MKRIDLLIGSKYGEWLVLSRVESKNHGSRLPFEDSSHMHADHKHLETPEPRGLLCSTCNTGIGMLKDSPELCKAAAEYLESWA